MTDREVDMRKHSIRFTAFLLALAMVIAAFPASAFAIDTSAKSGVATVVTSVSGEHEFTHRWYYDDKWFTEDADDLSESTEEHLLVLSSIAVGTTTSDSNSSRKNVTEMLQDMGFTDINYNRYCLANEKLNMSMGVTIGQKKITTSDGAFTLLAVFPRSAGYENEWAGNFALDESGAHAGFKAARDEILRYMKFYIKYYCGSETEFKVWTAGYSRGAATANLLAGFLSDDPGYFDDSKHKPLFNTSNVFAYTFGTPLSIDADTTKGDALSVSSARDEYGHDTEGYAFVYSAADAGDPVKPENGRRNIINIYHDGDYFARLPLKDWGFTRYGRQTELDYVVDDFGDGSMIALLNDIHPSFGEAYKNGNYDTYLSQKTFDLSTLTLVDDYSVEKISFVGLLEEREKGLVKLIPTRDQYVSEYQGIISPMMEIVGSEFMNMKEGGFNVSASALIKTGLSVYGAYAIDSVKQGKDMSDAEAATDVLESLIRFLSKVNVDLTDRTAEVGFILLLQHTLDNPRFAETLMGLIRTLQEKGTLDELVSGAGIGSSEPIVNVIDDLLQTTSDTDPVYSVDDLFKVVCAVLTDHYYNDKEFQALVSSLVKQLESGSAGAYLPLLTTIVKPYVPVDERDSLTVEQSIFVLLGGCVTGLKNYNEDGEDMTALEARTTILTLASGLMGLFIKDFSILDYPVLRSLITGVDPDIPKNQPFSALVAEFLQMLVGKDTTVAAYADKAIGDLLDAVSNDFRHDFSKNIEIVKTNPEPIRKFVTAVLFAPRDHYDLSADVRDAATLYDRSGLLIISHFLEQYITYLQIWDSNYSSAAASVLSPVYDDNDGIIGYTTEHYNTLQEALDAAPYEAIVKLETDLFYLAGPDEPAVNIKTKADITFDFNGHILFIYDDHTGGEYDITGINIQKDASVRFTDSTDNTDNSGILVVNTNGGNCTAFSAGLDSWIDFENIAVLSLITTEKPGLFIDAPDAAYIRIYGGSYRGGIRLGEDFRDKGRFNITGGRYTLTASELIEIDDTLDPSSDRHYYEIVPDDADSDGFNSKVVKVYSPMGYQYPVVKDADGKRITSSTFLYPDMLIYASGVTGSDVIYIWWTSHEKDAVIDLEYIDEERDLWDDRHWIDADDANKYLHVTAFEVDSDNNEHRPVPVILGQTTTVGYIESYEATDGTAYYKTLQEAFDSVEDFGTVTLLCNIYREDGTSYVISGDKSVTFDMNGYDIEVGSDELEKEVTAFRIEEDASLTVIDSYYWHSTIAPHAAEGYSTTAIDCEGYLSIPEKDNGADIWLFGKYAVKASGKNAYVCLAGGEIAGDLYKNPAISDSDCRIMGGSYFVDSDFHDPTAMGDQIWDYIRSYMIKFDPSLVHGSELHTYEIVNETMEAYGDEPEEGYCRVRFCYKELDTSKAPVLKKNGTAVTSTTVINPDDVLKAEFLEENGYPIVFEWYKDGKAVEDHISDTYTVTSADVGKKISVKAVQEEGEDGAYLDSFIYSKASVETAAVSSKGGGGGGSGGGGSSGGGSSGGGGSSSGGSSTVTPVNNTAGTAPIDSIQLTETGLTASDYRDVDPRRWSAEFINFCIANGIMKGNGDGTFSPFELISKGTVTQVLYNLHKNAAPGSVARYKDGAKLLWFADAFGWASNENLVTGNPDGTSGGMDDASREQTITIMYRYAKLVGMDVDKHADLSQFRDSGNVRDYSRAAFEWAVAVGLINGDEGRLNVDDTTDREQLSAIVTRFVRLMQSELKTSKK